MFKTEQEKFWAGDFGDAYVDRNDGEKVIASNTALFSKVLQRTGPLKSVVEFGANIGLNLMALQRLQPGLKAAGVEINAKAAERLGSIPDVTALHGSLLEVDAPVADLALIKGVLIHLNPDWLPQVYERLHRSAGKWLLVAEYYNPSPVEVPYRGHSGRLFKRDFAGEILDRFKDLRVADYGFVWRRDPSFPQDDITWFLLERRG